MKRKKRKKMVKAKAKIKIPKIKLFGVATKVFADIQNDNAKRIAINAKLDSKRNYRTDNAVYFWRSMAMAFNAKAITKELRVMTKSNTKERRAWCEKNRAVIVDMSKVTETELGDINERDENGRKNYRPENALRIRLSKISQGKKLGYVRVISDYEFQHDIKLSKAHLVYLYKI